MPDFYLKIRKTLPIEVVQASGETYQHAIQAVLDSAAPGEDIEIMQTAAVPAGAIGGATGGAF